LVTEIAVRNPRVVPTSVAILSLLIRQIKDTTVKKLIIKRIYGKFQQIPNSSYLKVWLQRLSIKIDETIIYDELLCKKVVNKDVRIWNVDWTNKSLRELIIKTPIILSSKVKTLRAVVSKNEINRMATRRAYDYE
jgi:hypothetical protein